MRNNKSELIRIVTPLAKDQAAAEKYADHLLSLFYLLNPSQISLTYQMAMMREDMADCVKEAAAYFRNKPDVALFSRTLPYDVQRAEDAVRGIMHEVSVTWTYPDGQVDFLFNATTVLPPVNYEWQWQLNRHNYWPDMARARIQTNDHRYSAALIRQVLDWIAQTEPDENYNGPGSAWRTIECGLRLLGSWPAMFEAIRKADDVPDAVLLLIIASMHRQAVHLAEHPTGANWLMMEANGMFTFASLFPELTDAERIKQLSAKWLTEELEKQVLPDGMQNELSPDYHRVVLGCACNFYDVAQAVGEAEQVPASVPKLIKKMVHASVLMSTPAFTQPRTNDCYTIPTPSITGRVEHIFPSDPEFAFVNSQRKQGMPPAGETASAFLPYAGFSVMRSDWGKDAAYLCFDVGPLGMRHEHQDMLNINLFKGEEELLYDDGGGQYDLSEARKYGISSYAHNLVLVDGMPQTRKEPLMMEEPINAGWITNEQFDYAFGIYDGTFGDGCLPAVHKREVRFCKPGFFAVADTLTSRDGKEHDYDQLFHVDTLKLHTIPELHGAVLTEFGKTYELLIVPVGEQPAMPQLISGQTQPVYQGWFDGRNDCNVHEATTVVYHGKGISHRFHTLLIPVRKGGPLPDIRQEEQKCTVKLDGRHYAVDFHALSTM